MNALLRHGAAPVLCVDDVLEAIGVCVEPSRRAEPEGDVGRVLAALRDMPATPDELVRAVGLPAAEVSALLTAHELDGLITAGDGVFRAT